MIYGFISPCGATGVLWSSLCGKTLIRVSLRLESEMLPNGEYSKLHKALYNQNRLFSPPSNPSIKVFWGGDLLPHRLRSYPAVWSDRVAGHGRLEGEREFRLGFIESKFIPRIVRVLNDEVQRRSYMIRILRTTAYKVSLSVTVMHR